MATLIANLHSYEVWVRKVTNKPMVMDKSVKGRADMVSKDSANASQLWMQSVDGVWQTVKSGDGSRKRGCALRSRRGPGAGTSCESHK